MSSKQSAVRGRICHQSGVPAAIRAAGREKRDLFGRANVIGVQAAVRPLDTALATSTPAERRLGRFLKRILKNLRKFQKVRRGNVSRTLMRIRWGTLIRVGEGVAGAADIRGIRRLDRRLRFASKKEIV